MLVSAFVIVPAAHAQSVTLYPGQSQSASLQCSSDPSSTVDLTEYWTASGTASAWTSPNYYDCGTLSPGQRFAFDFTVTVPNDAVLGTYALTWTGYCTLIGSPNPCGGSGESTDYTIVVEGQTTTTEQQVTTTSVESTSVSYSTAQCAPGEHLGGIPNSNSFICVPDGLQVDEGGTPSVTPVGDGSLVDTQGGSVVDITCLSSSSCPTGPDSTYLGSSTTAAVDTTSCSTVTDCATATYQWYQKFNSACQADPGCARAWDLAKNFNDYANQISEFIAKANQEGFLSTGTNKIVALVNAWAWQKCEHALTQAYKFITTNGAVVPVGDGDPELGIFKGANGTTYYDIKGQAFVESFASNQTILLSPGQELSIPSNSALASQQTLSSSVKTFSPTNMNQWWNTSHRTPVGQVVGGVLVIAVVALAGVLVVRRAMGRRLPPPPPM
jgi:hypothetical protein